MSGILEKMGKTLDEYYSMNQVQQKEIWDLLNLSYLMEGFGFNNINSFKSDTLDAA